MKLIRPCDMVEMLVRSTTGQGAGAGGSTGDFDNAAWPTALRSI